MTETHICPECEMEFNWPAVEADGELYCCEACSLGEPCECPQHNHAATDTEMPLPTSVRNVGPM